jgi:hypothetical protein
VSDSPVGATPRAGEALWLSDAAARRVLARAGELEAARGAGVAAARLREAALEAGISAAAFDVALAEEVSAESGNAATPQRTVAWGFASRRRAAAMAVFGLIVTASAIAVVASGRSRPPRWQPASAARAAAPARMVRMTTTQAPAGRSR